MANHPINNLIDDCLEEIFSYLSLCDLIIAEKVCSRWKLLCQRVKKPINKLHYEKNKFIFSGTCKKKYVVEGTNNEKLILQHYGSSINDCHLIKLVDNIEKLSPIFKIIGQYCENIQRLFITSKYADRRELISDFNNKELAKLIGRNQNLIFFSLDAEPDLKLIKDNFINFLPSTLVGLRFVNCQLSNFAISAFKRMKNLQHLTLLDCGYIHQYILDVMIYWSDTIRRLNVGLCLISDEEFINIIRHFKQLNVLDVSGCFQLTSDGLCSIGELEHLERLRISDLKNLTDVVLDSLPNTFTEFKCSECETITDDGIIRLIQRASNLTLLNVQNCSGITNKTVIAAIELVMKQSRKDVLRIYCSGSKIELSEIKKMYNQDINAITQFLKIF